MKPTLKTAAVVLAGIVLLACAFVAGQRASRFVVINSSTPLRLDRVTGQSWILDGEQWVRVVEAAPKTNEIKPQIVHLPNGQLLRFPANISDEEITSAILREIYRTNPAPQSVSAWYVDSVYERSIKLPANR